MSTTEATKKFSKHLEQAFQAAAVVAHERGVDRVSSLFLLWSLTKQPHSLAGRLLNHYGITTTLCERHFPPRRKTKRTSPSRVRALLLPTFTLEAQRIIEHAAWSAFNMKHPYIGTEHLLLALLQQVDETVVHIFEDAGVDLKSIASQVTELLNSSSTLTELHELLNAAPVQQHTHVSNEEGSDEGVVSQESMTPALDWFGRDLTSAAIAEELDPVIGRSAEIERLIQILARRSKNNPVLIGEPGVGKTAIVEGLARRIFEGEVPEFLMNKRIIALDLGLIIAGTMYRGDVESRLKQLLEELSANRHVIVFIDEIHMLVGAGGSGANSMDAANLLKPALAKGEIACIGATTITEYRASIESDSALDRRFQSIMVHEPTDHEAMTILKSTKNIFEKFHHVRIPDSIITQAVQWSLRFLPDQHLPDKAFDLIDEAAARTHLNRDWPTPVQTLYKLRRMSKRVKRLKDKAMKNELIDEAADLYNQEKELQDMFAELEPYLTNLKVPPAVVTADDVAAVLASRTGIPVDHITAQGVGRCEKLEADLNAVVVGQSEAIAKVSQVLKRAAAGLQSPDRPLGSFLFLGPSGVGKTLLAQTIARQYFGDEDALIRVDMSEFSEGFTVSKLLGSPAGYVGHKDDVRFVEQIRKRPYAVVLFDELEKAHPDVFQLLLQLLDEGRLTDATGRELNFRHTVVIMTSNIGLDALNRQAALGFSSGTTSAGESMAAIQKTIAEEVSYILPQEFLNRIDYQMIFQPLTEKMVEQIVKREFVPVAARAKQHGIKLHLSAAARKQIAVQAFNPDQGARLVRRTLAEVIETPLADLLLSASVAAGDAVNIVAQDGKIVLQRAPAVVTKKPLKKKMKKRASVTA